MYPLYTVTVWSWQPVKTTPEVVNQVWAGICNISIRGGHCMNKRLVSKCIAECDSCVVMLKSTKDFQRQTKHLLWHNGWVVFTVKIKIKERWRIIGVSMVLRILDGFLDTAGQSWFAFLKAHIVWVHTIVIFSTQSLYRLYRSPRALFKVAFWASCNQLQCKAPHSIFSYMHCARHFSKVPLVLWWQCLQLYLNKALEGFLFKQNTTTNITISSHYLHEL